MIDSFFLLLLLLRSIDDGGREFASSNLLSQLRSGIISSISVAIAAAIVAVFAPLLFSYSNVVESANGFPAADPIQQ
jgi:ABC-type Fe3+ transport system permease subunit